MKYIIKGSLCGFLCEECSEPLGGVQVLLYLPWQSERITENVVANAKETFRVVSKEESDQRKSLLIATSETDENGNFQFSVDEKLSRSAFDIDFVCGSVPHAKPKPRKEALQFHITTFYPQWRIDREQENYYFIWQYCIPSRTWCNVRGYYFDAWTIFGRLKSCSSDSAIANVTVKAWDADLITDDYLGSAVTDATGHFRIDYTSADFKINFIPLNLETDPSWPFFSSGPDVYFKYEYNGATIQAETSANRRNNVGYCLCVDLCINPPVHLQALITDPSACTHGDGTILPGLTLTPIKGNAGGIGFAYYALELLWNGTLPISNAIIYSNSSSNPDTSLTQGNHEVNNDILGFVDLEKAAQGAGANILTSTMFQLRLKVTGIDTSFVTAIINFKVASAKVYIGSIGGASAADATNPMEQLMSGGSIASIGGSVHVRGACNVYGCDAEKIASYNIWAINDDFAAAQPANNSVFNSAGWAQITHVDYINDDQRNYNVLDGSPYDDILTNVGWSTRKEWDYFDGLPVFSFDVPTLVPSAWGTALSGRYSVLLQLIDTSGNTYYDLQQVWIDNENITAVISGLFVNGLGNLPACTDLYTKDNAGNFRTMNVEGTAYDPLIITSVPSAPSDNFSRYLVSIQKQSAAGWVTMIDSSTPVPARPNPIGIGDIVSNYSLQNFDADTNPGHLDADQLLGPGEACNYVIKLEVWDKTIVSESYSHYDSRLFPVKIINSNQP